MNMYSRMLYKTPGPHDIHGGKFDTLVVRDEAEQEAAQADGWYLTTTDAIAPKVEAPVVDDTAPPTRAELEQKATELNIKFDGRTSDKKLAELIAAAIEK